MIIKLLSVVLLGILTYEVSPILYEASRDYISLSLLSVYLFELPTLYLFVTGGSARIGAALVGLYSTSLMLMLCLYGHMSLTLYLMLGLLMAKSLLLFLNKTRLPKNEHPFAERYLLSLFLFVSALSFGLASYLDYPFVRIFRDYVMFIYGLLGVVGLIVLLENVVILAPLTALIWSIFYVRMYLIYGPFEYVFWVVTLVVHIIFIAVYSYRLFQSYRIETNRT